MFTIGIASQHPPLPTSGQLSELGIAFLREALTIDPEERPSAAELINHPWIQDARDQLTAMNEEESDPNARSSATSSSSSRSNAVSSLGTSSLGSINPGTVLEEEEEPEGGYEAYEGEYEENGVVYEEGEGEGPDAIAEEEPEDDA
jgi:mitogen-activated protein kinase kinase kinase